MVMTTGPVRASTGTSVSGSFQRCSNSRLSVEVSASARQKPSSADRNSTTPATISARRTPSTWAVKPQSQLPSAMPANVNIWYSDKARATTQRGADICTATLKVESAVTQAAPATTSVGSETSIELLIATTNIATANAIVATRTMLSV